MEVVPAKSGRVDWRVVDQGVGTDEVIVGIIVGCDGLFQGSTLIELGGVPEAINVRGNGVALAMEHRAGKVPAEAARMDDSGSLPGRGPAQTFGLRQVHRGALWRLVAVERPDG